MSDQDQEIYVSREHKTGHYDKRLISKIVKEVENGLPRKEAIRIYGLGKSSLDSWMRTYGSLEYQEKSKRKTYTNLQKRTIVSAIEQGRLTIKDAKIAYHIKSEKSIRDWIKQYKSEKVEICIENTLPMAKVKPSVQDLEKEALHKALQEAELRIKALNTLIDVAEDQLKIDIRKKSGAKQSQK
ncbi:transposase [Kaistella flava (ex Peng et al. 2021)]|uniref:Transposase n=1 Tax=Kaistella flava (ex Peng et al. 2021) TaxID=2038776 RepID=A0A7M2Y716_9FLAO|nr:transposase [Kaistella flava (ex Peng et al. 2021)]QOW10048.1 transposase [Kaistella flava (ex Peng et al. 2021)]